MTGESAAERVRPAASLAAAGAAKGAGQAVVACGRGWEGVVEGWVVLVQAVAVVEAGRVAMAAAEAGVAATGVAATGVAAAAATTTAAAATMAAAAAAMATAVAAAGGWAAAIARRHMPGTRPVPSPTCLPWRTARSRPARPGCC